MTESFTLRIPDEDDFDHDDIWNADSCEIGEAIVRLAVDNPDLLKLKLDEVSNNE